MARPGGGLLVYHAGGLGDLVLSVPAILRVAAGVGSGPRRFWGPADRRALLPGFDPPPPVLLRTGHTLWGDAPDPVALEALERFHRVLAFGGRNPPPWAKGVTSNLLPLSSFPPPGERWVPAHQARQLDRLGVAPHPEPQLPRWRRGVLPGRTPETVVIHPGSGDPKKNWPAEFWARVAAALKAETGLPVVELLGPAETERWNGAALAGVSDETAVCESVEASLAVLSRAALYLGNDAGPTHLAAALGVPTLAVFGPTDPALWRPLGPAVRVVAGRLECAPCTAGGSIGCGDPRCLESVSPTRVLAAARGWVSPDVFVENDSRLGERGR